MEAMERRRMLSVAVNSGVLTITGGNGADTFLVATNSPTTLTVSENAGMPQIVSGVVSILANLGGGDDTLIISSDVAQNAVANGEAGNDTITGGAGADTIDGGIGDDLLNGSGGLDTVTYASRSEAITGNLAVLFNSLHHLQSITGTAGATGETDTYTNVETLTGGSGNDSLTASAAPGNTDPVAADVVTVRLNGGDGDDHLLIAGVIDGNVPKSVPREIADGGEGNDDLTANYNRSDVTTLVGGNGDDTFHNNDDSLATIDPGAGYDTFDFHTVGVTTYTMPLGLENVVTTGGSAATITGNAEANRIELGSGGTALGLGGDDELISGPSADCTLNGGDGDDTITSAGTGELLVRPGAGDDSVVGNSGPNTVSYDDRSTPITGSLRTKVIQIGQPGNTQWIIQITGSMTASGGETDTFTNITTLIGGSGNDSLSTGGDSQSANWGNISDQYIRPDIVIDGGSGDDSFTVAGALDGTSIAYSANKHALGGDGDDTFFDIDEGHATLDGGAGDDDFTIGGEDGPPAGVIPGDGVDEVHVNSILGVDYTMPLGLEKLFAGGSSPLKITGSADANEIHIANGGHPTINSGAGNDTIITTGGGSYLIDAGPGDDTVRINDGADINVIGSDRSNIDGGDGGDLIVINGGTDTIHGGAGNDSIYAGVGDDRAFGDEGDDRLNGDGGKDTIYGGDGNDRVYGNSGADRLFGETGVDRLYGGNKNDYLDGGAGGDYIKGDEDFDTAKRDKKDRRYESIEIFV